jgi:hypothetical protein
MCTDRAASASAPDVMRAANLTDRLLKSRVVRHHFAESTFGGGSATSHPCSSQWSQLLKRRDPANGTVRTITRCWGPLVVTTPGSRFRRGLWLRIRLRCRVYSFVPSRDGRLGARLLLPERTKLIDRPDKRRGRLIEPFRYELEAIGTPVPRVSRGTISGPENASQMRHRKSERADPYSKNRPVY